MNVVNVYIKSVKQFNNIYKYLLQEVVMQDFIKINKDDNVAVALKPIAKGTTVNVAGTEVTTIEDIPQGHKFVIKPIKKGDAVIKYGFRIGYAQADIEVGGWVHTHNLKTALGELLEYTYNPEGHKDVEPTEEAFFDGYMRENGTVGVRNEVWIIPTVGCVNSIARAIEATARANKPEGVDEVVAFPHPYGCSQVTEDQENTRHVLADLINHPNAGAVLVLGLGCENSRIEVLKDYIGEVNPDRVKFLQVQDVENEQEVAEGIMKELMDYAATFKREKVGFAALDTFEGEAGLYYLNKETQKLDNDNMAILKSFPNVILSPHMAFYTEQAVSDMVENSIRGILGLENGDNSLEVM